MNKTSGSFKIFPVTGLPIRVRHGWEDCRARSLQQNTRTSAARCHNTLRAHNHNICVQCHTAAHSITHLPTDRAIMPILITFLQPSGQCGRYILKHFQLVNFSPAPALFMRCYSVAVLYRVWDCSTLCSVPVLLIGTACLHLNLSRTPPS